MLVQDLFSLQGSHNKSAATKQEKKRTNIMSTRKETNIMSTIYINYFKIPTNLYVVTKLVHRRAITLNGSVQHSVAIL